MGSTLFLENVNELVRYVRPNVLTTYVSLSLIDPNINILYDEIGLVFKYRFGKLGCLSRRNFYFLSNAFLQDFFFT